MAESKGVGHWLVAAIDFGTTYSGYAFSTTTDFMADPNKICSKVWYAGTGNISSLKTSTCVLYKPNGTFHSFGFQAEDKYTELAEVDQHRDWFFFSRFKMHLYKMMVGLNNGGTVDVTVQEVQPDGGIKELYMANGGDWGGTKVDEAFKCMLCELFGEDVITKLSKEEKADFLEIFRGFEMKKRIIGPETDSSVFIRIPFRLNEIYKQKNGGKDMTNILKTSAAESIVSKFYSAIFAANKANPPTAVDERRKYMGFKRDKLELKPFVIRQLFQDSTTAISKHLKQILDEVRNVDTILLVGGYSESPMLRECIRRQFPRKRIIIPIESGLAVLKGAVIYGHNPSVFRERISRYTYGILESRPYIEGKHNPDYKFVDDTNEVRCDNMFSRHIQKGETVTIGKTHSSERLGFNENKERQTCHVYCSTDPDPKYITDPGCTKQGKVVLDIPLSDLDIYKDEATIKFSFSGTEFEVKAVFRKTGKTAKSFFRFET